MNKISVIITNNAEKIIISTGIALRMCYSFFTDASVRTYDVYREAWGHLDYIKYIAENLSLPPVNECQAYHPPVHHIISAAALNIGKLFLKTESSQLKFIQMVMLIFSSLTLIFLYKLLREFSYDKTIILTGTAFFAFHPTNIYFAARINNDTVMFFFYTAALYYLFKWQKSKAPSDLVYLALTAALSMLSKLSGVILAPIIATAFFSSLIRNKKSSKSLIRQYLLFASIYIPLAISYTLRNYILFGQKFNYVPTLGVSFKPSFTNLIYIPVNKIFNEPFNNGGLNGGEFFMDFFIKSSLFGEWAYPGLEKYARLLIFLSIFIVLITTVHLFCARKHIFENSRYLLLLNLLIPVFLVMKLRTDLPVACSQDFRYAAPILISLSVFLGEAVAKLKKSGYRLLSNILICSIPLFCATAAIFILKLRNYN